MYTLVAVTILTEGFTVGQYAAAVDVYVSYSVTVVGSTSLERYACVADLVTYFVTSVVNGTVTITSLVIVVSSDTVAVLVNVDVTVRGSQLSMGLLSDE